MLALQTNPKLRHESRIRSIHSSLAIEQNTLTLDQVTDVIDGKVGVYAGNQLIHAGSPANYVPDLMRKLFGWMKRYHCSR